MAHTALVLGDQLSHDNPVLDGADRVLLIESRVVMVRRRLHRQRRHLVLSAMRHFASELRERGVEVEERRGMPRMEEVLAEFADVACAEPNSAPARRKLAGLGVRFVPSTQFLTSPEAFAAWAAGRGRRRLVMEDFYRQQRVRLGLLVDDEGRPAGGRWNFDTENRRPVTAGLRAPDPWEPQEDEIDEEVRFDLDRLALDGMGRDGPRRFAATAAEARAQLEDFVAHRLAEFGPWQDAMVPGQRYLFHSKMSAPMNLWLISPLEVVRAVEDAYHRGAAPLQSVEGYVRQVIGWREYVWGMYWLREDVWRQRNALGAEHGLPPALRDGKTDLNCLRGVMESVLDHAYAHHIERLMVLGNLQMLLGVRPEESIDWFQSAFIDGGEWVMAPNAAGMAHHADGGEMFTKPYAGGGNYINRMSGFCPGCRYEPKQRTGPDACPVTALYWDFIARHRERFADNRRMRGPYRALAGMEASGELSAVRERAEEARRRLLAGEREEDGDARAS